MSAATIDFLRPRRTPLLGWCILALGASALVAAMWTDRHWASGRAEHDAALRLRDEVQQRAQRAALQPVSLTPDQRRLQRIAPLLRQPWLPALRLVENVTDAPLFLLTLAIDPATGAVRLDGEAPSFDQALAYAQALDDEGLMGPAQLRSHEFVNEPAMGRSSVRFSIVTRWRAR